MRIRHLFSEWSSGVLLDPCREALKQFSIAKDRQNPVFEECSVHLSKVIQCFVDYFVQGKTWFATAGLSSGLIYISSMLLVTKFCRRFLIVEDVEIVSVVFLVVTRIGNDERVILV